MKSFQQNLKKWAGVLGIVSLLAVTLSSCYKQNYNGDNTYNTGPTALLTVYNASPDSEPLNFYLDNNLVNNFPISYGHRLEYINAFAGKRLASYYIASTQQKVATDSIALSANADYSIFIANSEAKPDVLLLTDSLATPPLGMAAIRLVNVSANAPAVDLAVTGGNVLVHNKAYKGFSSFIPVNGNQSYNLEIRQVGTSTVLATLPNVNLYSGSVYTVWLHGVAGNSDISKLQADISTNAIY